MSSAIAATLYHEKQHLGHCAIHALNNLLQSRTFTYADFEQVATQLHAADKAAGIVSNLSCNGYQSIVPCWGNFDLGVIVELLQSQRLMVSEHITQGNLRTWEQSLSILNRGARAAGGAANIKGILVNQPGTYLGIFSTRHWYTIVNLFKDGGDNDDNGVDSCYLRFVNMNSNLDAPIPFESAEALDIFLHDAVNTTNCQLFFISAVQQEEQS